MLRLLEVVYVFARHLLFHWLRSELRRKHFAERLRMTLERLGPVYTKLGQFFAARDIPEAIKIELKKLFDGQSPLSFEIIEPIVKAALGLTRLEDYFSSFSREAFASASIAQIHIAERGGKKCVVKVLRPGARESVRRGLPSAKWWVFFRALVLGRIKYVRVAGAVSQIESWLLRETDFRIEAKNARLFQVGYAGVDCIVIPEVIFDSEEVLIEEFLEAGVPCHKWDERLVGQGYDARLSIRNLLTHTFGPPFRGIPVPIHGDPHPANILILPKGKAAFVDFGLVGEISEADLGLFNAVVFAVYAQNAKLTAEALMMLGGNPLRSEAKQLAFERDVARYVRACQTQPLDYWLFELGEIVIRHNIPTPEVFTLICRFGILGNAITQMFFPGWSTIDLVGREIEMGMLYQLFDRIRHLEPSALFPVAYRAVMRIERAPLDAAKFIEHPVATIAEILETLFGPIRKTAGAGSKRMPPAASPRQI